ncbi:cupredoxin domain-containing protein [Corynebacterium guangdongense]|uniref:Nitrite reductase (NO-forming) n=1 Tax=Corynebacterium guangdongense TaxID=1783348 RepID=A0ABU1ZZX7_9CORY|nr:copper oxidase [Corynebacterium guangdongense]MDR7330497.1 nitrite reductase (NO-forming) [Corynebacterium guangdongense]WJZ19053.1 hypothetical protein CGUA_12600 [Corynebacterium guangdongense]
MNDATTGTGARGGAGKLPTREWGAASWHRKAARPVTVWMMVFVLAGLTHVAIPEYRWVLIHIFTLGILTNSIVLWSQSLTEKFLQQKQPPETRPAQLRRTRLLNAGVVVTIVGEILVRWWDRHWILTQVGAALVALALTWHGVVLARQWLRSDKGKRFRPAVLGYVGASFALPLGAIFGGLLAMGLPGTWHNRVLMAHTIINLGGFLGLAAAASLTVLFPSIWRVNGLRDRSLPTLILLTVGLVAASAGALLDSGWLTGVGLLTYAAGWVISLQAWLGNVLSALRDPRDRLNYPSLSVLAAVLWLVGTVIHYAVQVMLAGEQIHLLRLPTMPLLLGFAAQLLIGVMSHLLPTTMGGGPAAKRAGLRELKRGGIFRVVLYNLGFILWQTSTHSWLKVLLSFLVFGVLVAFIPLMLRSVKAQKAVLLGERDSPREDDPAPRWGQATAALAVLAFVVALFGGLQGPATGPDAAGPTSATGAENVTVLELTSPGVFFEPDLIEVNSGDHVVLTYTNTDDMAHDLRFANGVDSGRLEPGQSAELDLGVLTADLEGWCTIAGHRVQGMVLSVVVR